MKKLFTFICILFTINTAIAASSPKTVEDNTGIVTPEIATGVIRTSKTAYSEMGIILVCPTQTNQYVTHNYRDDTCLDSKRNNAWVYLKDAIPKGTTYVGFKSVAQGSSHYIEIYWK